MRRYRGILALAPVLLLPLASCGGADEASDASPNAAAADGEVPPLTREQIEAEAEAMSPEVAESLGIVDTTIRIQSPMPSESVPGGIPGTEPAPPPQ